MAQRKVLLKRDGVTIIHLSKMSVMNITLLYPALSGPLKMKAKNMIFNGRYQKNQPLTSVEEDHTVYLGYNELSRDRRKWFVITEVRYIRG